MSIFAGMVIGLVLRLAASESVLHDVSFNNKMFFNVLLPPIILASGYELHQANFFRNIGAIITFAFAGTFISAVVLGIILFIWTRLNLDGVKVDFVEAISLGATLSATDPVTILAIFNAYQVDPKLYTVIFGESILNDAIAIVLFETAQKYKNMGSTLGIGSFFESIWTFLYVFASSLIIGLVIGIFTSLLLKFTYLRRFPKTESCIVVLIAYASYFFSTAISMSGIVSLLFCGICMKHYAYHNMSRRTQLTTKFIFQVLAQLSENFIFVYLGLSLFTERQLVFKPLFILATIVGICVARWCAVFPLSRLINWFIRYRAKRTGNSEPEELPYSHQVILFWAGLRGAVGVALAAGLTGGNGAVLRATVLVVVVLTVIIFGGTTARMLEILNIRTGVVEEPDSDDEFDSECIPHPTTGTSTRKSSISIGPHPRHGTGFAMDHVNLEQAQDRQGHYSSSHANGHLRKKSNSPTHRSRTTQDGTVAGQNLISPASAASPQTDEMDDAAVLEFGLPPDARRSRPRRSQYAPQQSPSHTATAARPDRTPNQHVGGRIANATGAITQLISGLSEDPAGAFRQIDEVFIKPHLLLDPHAGSSTGPNHHGGSV